MIAKLLTAVFNVVISLVDTLLSPIDLLISSALPDLSSGISAVGSMLNYAMTYLDYLIDMTCLSSETISLIILYYTFKLTIPITISTIKLAIRWYDKLKF